MKNEKSLTAKRIKRQKEGEKAPFAKRIDNLMGSRKQTAFAKTLDVNQATISVWLKGDPNHPPSPEMYLKLANAATEPDDILWFWEQAGLRRSRVLDCARSAWKRKFKVPPDWEWVRVWPLEESEDIGPLPVPRWTIGDPNSTRYFVANRIHTQMAFLPGIIFLDTKDSGGRLAPFWDKVVLARLHRNLVLGKLTMAMDGDREAEERKLSRFGYIGPINFGSPLYQKPMGEWFHPLLRREDWRAQLASVKDRWLFEEELEGLARREMIADSGIKILGVVIDWSAGAGRKKGGGENESPGNK